MKKIISLIVAPLALIAPATSFAQSTGATAGATATSGSSSVNAGTLVGSVTVVGGASSTQQSSTQTASQTNAQNTSLVATPTSTSGVTLDQKFEAAKPTIVAPTPLSVNNAPVGIFIDPQHQSANATGMPLEAAFLETCPIGDLGPDDMKPKKIDSEFATTMFTPLPGLRAAGGGEYGTVVQFGLPINDKLQYACIGIATVIDKPGADLVEAAAAAKDVFYSKFVPPHLGRVYLVTVHNAITATNGVATSGKGFGVSGSSDGLIGGATALLGLNLGVGANKGTTSTFAQPGMTFVAVVVAEHGVELNQQILSRFYASAATPPAATSTSPAISSTAAAPAAPPATTATTH